MPVASLEDHSAALVVAVDSFPCLPHTSGMTSTWTPTPLPSTLGWGMSYFPGRKGGPRRDLGPLPGGGAGESGGPWACLAHQLHRPLSYPLDTRFTFFSSENKEESRNKAPGPWNCASVCVCKAHPKADIPRASKKKKKKQSPLVTIPNMLWSPPCQEPCTLWLEPRLKSPSMLPMPSCIWRASGTPSCTPAASAVPLPIPVWKGLP